MKKTLVILLFFFHAFTMYSQKCKYDYERTDPFTGKTSKAIIETLEKSWKIELNKTDLNYEIILHLSLPGISNDFINAGDTLIIALENSKPLIFRALSNVNPRVNSVQIFKSYEIQSFYLPEYQAAIEQINQLAISKIIALKIYFNEKWYSIDVKSKNAKEILNAANCILK